ncbi:dTDP-4-dehydrorhamnose reductase [Olleya marilimosa]|uniref:dTDP-4-dehydrorhamnose reductase n=1 Tax=Olleya marilimosa TaxID=272164 RepID=UPI000486DE30|nr:dTDP-4-dehydrorhamnose reductase [Olleya marilimosa]MBD3890629.1 dTDP-4-dehydrorhamnose reductase [Olleya marilimosa]|tara:strand:- start:241717 stop:242568 length:852 start_codon:yes stop_codon:yes gene_type:complete
MKKILVTGSNGQLGSCIKIKSKEQKTLDFVFLDSKGLDVTNSKQIDEVFSNNNFDYCINCAAYTAVDQAEDESDIAYNINTLGAKNLAEASKKYKVTLIHVSTDFVFNGQAQVAYKETDITNPLGVYGSTKLEGEKEIQSKLSEYYIIRTSWLYSEFKNNFLKTMLNLASKMDALGVVNDQFGTPTNANDLSEAILKIIISEKKEYGLYHFSNLGETTWYEFAKAIFDLTNTNIKLTPISTEQYKTKALRPKYSVLDKTKIIKTFDLNILNWEKSLKKHFNKL